MSVRGAYGRTGLVASALARAEAWLLEPAEAVEPTWPGRRPEPLELRPRRVVTVVGLAGGCGATTVARGLAAELAARDPGGTAAVCSTGSVPGLALGTAAAGRLARSLGRFAEREPRVAGRLCLIESGDHGALAEATRYLAPLVIEVGREAPPAAAVSVADHVILVAAPGVEPSLASVVAQSLEPCGPRPVTVLNRAAALGPWEGRAELVLPESRVAAQLASSGREPRGELGRAITELAYRCEEVSSS